LVLIEFETGIEPEQALEEVGRFVLQATSRPSSPGGEPTDQRSETESAGLR
jgi:hypothetical protein